MSGADRRSTTDPRRVPGRNLTHGMLDSLGRAIVTGAYAARSFPTEGELARQHGVSRSVTREAVKMLTTKGLLTARPRHGTSVQPQSAWNLLDPDVLRWLMERSFSVELLRQLNELRLGIEPAAAALAARTAEPEGLAAIAAGLERMAAAEQGRDDPLDADIAFHVAILGATGNPFFHQFRDLVAAGLRTSIRFTNQLAGHSASIPDHAAVLKAIEARDPAQAGAAMTAIIVDVLELIDQPATERNARRAP